MPKERIDVLELLRKGAWTARWTFSARPRASWRTGSLKPRSRPQIGGRVRRTDSGPYNAPQRLPDTRLGYSFGAIDLHIPKIREGRYSPALLEPRHRSERAQLFVVQAAFVEGVSTRRVDDLGNALGCDSLSKSQGSRIC